MLVYQPHHKSGTVFYGSSDKVPSVRGQFQLVTNLINSLLQRSQIALHTISLNWDCSAEPTRNKTVKTHAYKV